MSRLAYPLYIDRGGEQVNRHPVELTGVTLRSFFLRAEQKRLEDVCDKYLNAPLQGRLTYVPFVSRVVLVFADIAKAMSVDPLQRAYGWMSEIDVAFWVLAAAKTREGWVDHLAWFLPYTFVDSSYAMALGRETYGFAKAIGEFEFPKDLAPARLSVRTLAIEHASPTSRAAVQEILVVERLADEEATEHEPAEAWAVPEPFVSALSESLTELEAPAPNEEALPTLAEVTGRAIDLAAHILGGRVPMVFLKQFRDVRDPLRACYQAVVKAPARLTRFRAGGRMPGRYRFFTKPFDSHPFVTELGVGPEDDLIGFWSEFDFRMEVGEEIVRNI